MEIIPKIGLGPLRFGMTPSQVQAVLGSKRTYEPWMGGNRNDSLLYPGLIAGFDKCDSNGPLEDSCLLEFSIKERSDITLFNKPLMGMPREEFLQELARRHIRCENNQASIVLPDLQMEVDTDDQGRIVWVEFWGKSMTSSSPQASQRFLSDDELRAASASVDWKFWIGPVIFTLAYFAAAILALYVDLLMELIFLAGLGIPAILFWYVRIKEYRKFARDRHLRGVELVEGAPECVWLSGNGMCYLRLGGQNFRVENWQYKELRDANFVRIEFLPQSRIAVRVTISHGIALSR